MSKTFRIRNKDLEVGPGGYVLVSGRDKVHQDLGIAVREPAGSDRFHPGWGTILHNLLGQPASNEMALRIKSEIQRLVSNYIQLQHEQVVQDAQNRRRSRFATEELVERVRSVDVVQEYDRFHVTAVVETLAGDRVTLSTSVQP